MKSVLNTREPNKKIVSMMENDRTKFEVYEWQELNGGTSFHEASTLFYLKDANIKLKEVRISLKESSVRLEPGAMYYQKGDIEMNSKAGGLAGLGKKLFKSAVTNETTFKPEYKGSGELYLEPTFGHFALIELEDEEIIVDDGVFYACESSIDVGAQGMKNISSALMGGEGFFQTKLSGSGIALLELPVPQEEIVEYNLENETLKVDGNFAVLRSGSLDFTVEKSTKSLIGSATSGEGLLNVYRGTGTVWVLPTKKVYDELKFYGVQSMTNPKGSRNNKE